MGGLGYATNEIITIGDSDLGGGGANFTFKVLTIGTWGALQIELATDQKSSMTDAIDRENSNRWEGHEEGPKLGGENNAVNDQLRIDGQVFYSSANVTFDVIQLLKKLEVIKIDFLVTV